MKSISYLLVLCLIAGMTGCGGNVQITPSGNGVIIRVSGTGQQGATPPAAPTSTPQSPTNPTDPGPNLPPPTATTQPPSGPSPTPPPQNGTVTPPLGASSGGTGGQSPLSGTTQQAGNVSYNLIVPSSYSRTPTPFMIVYSGVEGAGQMTSNLKQIAQAMGIGAFIIAVLDGKTYYGDGQAGATVLDDVRAKYNVDNDRTYLLSESAGTKAGEQLGFHLRPSYFAAFCVNDVNNADAPAQTAAQLGFAPWGQVGPGGQTAIAQSIVDGMRTAGYRLPSPAPYNGPGANQHGNPQQFYEAIRFFPGKTRQ
ncbi:MAG: hypothetical protein HY815_31035 [Candidatus Riflebacteria bacterium]|nr:hypothetical protein [Candidatus Riflebacteria bacterium]